MRKLLNEELARLNADEFKTSDKAPVVLLLDNVRSHLNVGSIFRTADAFRLEAIYLCGITGCPPHRDIHKTALGATETVVWKHFVSAMEALVLLREEGYTIVAVEQAERAVMLHEFVAQGDRKYVFVFGNEVDGVGQELVSSSDMVLEIPQWGTKHSLNVAVSVGVVVWEAMKQLTAGSSPLTGNRQL
ncbi:MAG: TrmH family RNA methyltransferase [Bacteroidetes bacterium]|nr:TrmH family RNA methyltransferase [Bacteroidota bacterium]